MPILKEERNILPDDLLERESDGAGRRWWAVYTKARQEKALARDLVERCVPFYLPLVERTTLVRGKRMRSLAPLFSGYVFLCANDDERLKALRTNRTSQLVAVPDQQRLKHDLRQVQRLIAAKAAVTLEPRLSPGQRVRVKSGSFLGIEGVVEACRGGCRLIVEVKFLQQGVSVEIDELQVEAV
jgi:transcription antitermination factor NusG